MGPGRARGGADRSRSRPAQKRFASKLQLLETAKGERLVRFSYSGPGGGVRGPVTLRARDIGKLKAALAKYPELSETLGL